MWAMGRLLLLTGSLFCVQAGAIEYIAPRDALSLKSQFSIATVPAETDLAAVAGKEWRCDMYGMRTRLQVERDLPLYKFTKANSTWRNDGAQLVKAYSAQSESLKGTSGRVTDEVRMAGHGTQLIGRMSLEGSTVLAYTTCKLADSL
jgi:hypothetical protein